VSKKLVIVESPAKARTIGRFLGADFKVMASKGHIRDLPENSLGVDLSNDFAPEYGVPKEKALVVKELREAAAGASSIYLATDPDREGEAIAWHLAQVIKSGRKTVERVVFHEITKEAVDAAFRHPRAIDEKLVDAQQARRVLDRLVGYLISPLLWDSIKRGLSAGRVQSVALRIVVDREREIEAFVPVEYWDLGSRLARQQDGDAPALPFKAALHSLLGARGKLEVHAQADAEAIAAYLRGAAYRVLDVRHKQGQRNPAPPFITSTLQQEAWRKLRLSARRTMALAQQLYEGLPLGGEGPVGLITYMRTDSVQVAAAAKQEARAYIAQRFGPPYLPPHPRTYTQKAKGAQEAHEAIRPTSMFREPASLKDSLTSDQLRLYELIWKRMLASQMASAVIASTAVDVAAEGGGSGPGYLLRATGSTVKFPGFIALYTEGRDEAAEDEGQTPLPALDAGEALRLLEVLAEQKFTQPPPRYTEATLVKALEEDGIGRPSTYAPTVATIEDRQYVTKESGRLKPTGLGLLVSDLLTKHFADIMDVGFTATMEQDLDEIAQGKRPWTPVVKEFYQPFAVDLERAQHSLSHAALGEAEPVCDCTGSPKCKHDGPCGKPMALKESRWKSKFWGCTGYPECSRTKSLKLLEAKAALEEPTDQVCDCAGSPKCEHTEPCGKPLVIKTGRFGRFLACTGYPDCKNTKPIVVGTGVKCPKDGGEILQRKSRKGKTFYSCANYPQCDFSLGARPIPEPCPHCGGLRVSFRRGGARCTVCAKPSRVARKAEEPEAVGAA